MTARGEILSLNMKIFNAKFWVQGIFLLCLVLFSGFYIPNREKKREIPILTIEPSQSFVQIDFTVRKDNKTDEVIKKLERLRFYLSKKDDNSRERFLLVSAAQPNSAIIGMKFFLYYKNVIIANIHVSRRLHHRDATIFSLPEGILDFKNLPLKSSEAFDERFLKIEILTFGMMK